MTRVVASPVPLTRGKTPTRIAARVVVGHEKERGLAIVSDAEARRVDIVDVSAGKEIASLVVDSPGAALVLADGSIAVAIRDGIGILSLDADHILRAKRRIAVGHDVTAFVLAPDDRNLVVAGARTLEGFDVASGMRIFSTALPLAPSAVTIDPEGKHAFVTSKTASDALLVDLATHAIQSTRLDATGQDVEGVGSEIWDAKEKAWTFGGGMMTNHRKSALMGQIVRARHAGAIAPVAEVAYIAHEMLVPTARAAEEGEDPDPPTYGGSALLSSAELLAVSVLDTRTGKRISIHGAETKCRLPRGQVFDASTKRLWVACAGTNAVVALAWSPNAWNNGTYLQRRPATYRVAKTIALEGPPEGLAIDDEGRVLVSAAWSSQLSILETDGRVHTVALSSDEKLDPVVARGRILFHRSADPRISVDGRTCATCHIDGETDALEWRTKRGVRSTPVLAGRVDRPGAFGWNGESADLRTHIDQTIKKNLGGKGISAADVDDLAAYVRSMLPKSATIADHGQHVFVSAGCASCHSDGGRGTDGELHRIGVGKSSPFQTPSLVGLSRSAPYFHDGRYATLEQLLDETDGKMGTTRGLPPPDRDALLRYLKSL